jgi:hypothetical protein
MNLDIHRDHSPAADSVGGKWRNVRWQPNPSTGELLNIGVVFETAQGTTHVRMLDYFDRLKCLYDGSLAKDAKFLIDVTREALVAGIALPASNVVLSEPKFASGSSSEDILSMLFAATVPLGTPRETLLAHERSSSLMTQRTEDVRRIVLNELKRISGEKASRIINSEGYMQVNDGNRVYQLDIPLHTQTALGTIVSVKSKLPRTELALHRADTDLQIARQIYSKDDLFMYVVRAETGGSLEKVDSLLDEFTWKFKRMGVQMKTYTDAELIAPDIMDDMPVKSWM